MKFFLAAAAIAATSAATFAETFTTACEGETKCTTDTCCDLKNDSTTKRQCVTAAQQTSFKDGFTDSGDSKKWTLTCPASGNSASGMAAAGAAAVAGYLLL